MKTFWLFSVDTPKKPVTVSMAHNKNYNYSFSKAEYLFQQVHVVLFNHVCLLLHTFLLVVKMD